MSHATNRFLWQNWPWQPKTVMLAYHVWRDSPMWNTWIHHQFPDPTGYTCGPTDPTRGRFLKIPNHTHISAELSFVSLPVDRGPDSKLEFEFRILSSTMSGSVWKVLFDFYVVINFKIDTVSSIFKKSHFVFLHSFKCMEILWDVLLVSVLVRHFEFPIVGGYITSILF